MNDPVRVRSASSRRPGPSERRPEPSSPRPGRPNHPLGVFAEAAQFALALIAYAPRKSALALLLLLTAGVTETFGLLMVVPFLNMVGAEARPGEGGPVAEAVARAADAAGVELTLPAVLVVFLVLAAVRSAVAWQRTVFLASMRMGFTARLRGRLYAAVAGAQWEHLVGRRQSDMQHVLTGDVNRIGQGAFLMPQLVVTATLALLQVVLAALISPPLTAAAFAAGAVMLLLTRPLIRRSHTFGQMLTGANQTLYGSMADFLGGLKLAKSYNAEQLHVRRFTETVAAMREGQLAFTRASSTARAGLDMGAACVLAALIWFSVSAVKLPLPELLLMTLIFARVLPGLSRLQRYVQQLAYVLPAYAHAQAMHRALKAAAETPAASGPRMELRSALTVRDVSFVYGAAAARPALKSVSLEIPAGKITAIAGPSGAGKSTLADVLLGLLAPAGGEVRVDGALLTGSNLSRWRRSVACVPQDSYLFHDTIRANLQWALPEAAEAEMWRALRLAAADRFVAAWPEGLDTVAADRGERLSGGERQRIALARALMRRPALLVLDEATNQLDAENERRILAALESLRGRTTIVVIAHRTALLEWADRVVVLESGQVTAAGARREPATELAARAGPDESGVRRRHDKRPSRMRFEWP